MFCLVLGKKQLVRIMLVLLPVVLVATWVVNALSAPQEQEEGVPLPIIMYHSILKSRAGEYVLSPSVLEEDLSYLKENGYQAVVVADLIDYVYHNKPLPEKPVMLTFDDGFYNIISYAMPLLEKYDMRAVVSVVGSYTERYTHLEDRNPAYANLTWQDLAVLAQTGRIEVQSHSYDLHKLTPRKGAAKRRGENVEAYQAILAEDLSKMQRELLEKAGIQATAFAYPYGAISEASLPVVKDLGFFAYFTCIERPNCITKDPESLYLLNRYNRPSGISTERFMQRALRTPN